MTELIVFTVVAASEFDIMDDNAVAVAVAVVVVEPELTITPNFLNPSKFSNSTNMFFDV